MLKKVVASLERLGRFDFKLAAAQKLNSKDVKLAIAFNPKLGVPTNKQAVSFFEKQLPQLTPCMSTAVRKDANIIVYASVAEVTRPLTDCKQLSTVVAGLKYLDQDMGSVWEVVQEEGKQKLKQVHKFDVADLIKHRTSQMATASLALAVMPETFAVKDTVKFYHDNAQHEGVVKKIKDDSVTIDMLGGSMLTVDKNAIFKVIKHSPKKLAEQRKQQEQYWTEVHGPKFSKRMVD